MKKKDLSAVMSALGKRSAASMTKEQRKARAQKAVRARWDKKKAKEAQGTP